VRFSQPVPFYLENFLDLPVGTVVPAGYYDRERHHWIAERDGRVVKVLAVDAGLAVLDVSGGGSPATVEEMTALSITEPELARVAQLYAVDQTLWRVPIEHFSPHDFNFAAITPPGARAPQPEKIKKEERDPCANQRGGSIIECENQVLGETLPLVGTPFGLHYRSDRVPGREAAFQVEVPVMGEEPLPAILQGIEVELEIAGQKLTATRSPAVSDPVLFTWDGMDALGRELPSRQPFSARVGYVYPGDYTRVPEDCTNCFAMLPEGSFSLAPARQEVTIWQNQAGRLGIWDARSALELGGWTITPHHTFDPGEGVLYLGDGTRREPEDVRILATAAGDGVFGSTGDGGPASEARVSRLMKSEFRAEEGAFYFIDFDGCRLRRIGSDGIISTVAGSICPPSALPGDLAEHDPGDGLPATTVQLAWPRGFSFGPDGTLYIADQGHGLVRWVDSEGVIHSVAGSHALAEPPPDRTVLNSVNLVIGEPQDVAVGPDGSVYIVKVFGWVWSTILRLDLENGTYQCVLGCGPIQECIADLDDLRGIDGPARDARLVSPDRIRFARNGDLLVVDGGGTSTEMAIQSLLRIGSDGIVRRVAGTCTSDACDPDVDCRDFSPDGTRAREAFFSEIVDVSEGWDGSLFVTDRGNHVIRRIDASGKVTTVAGTGEAGFGGEGLPATGASLSAPKGAVAAPDGSLWVLDEGNYRIRRLENVYPPAPEFPNEAILVPSEDGSLLYVFDARGVHLRTENARTGQTLLTFGYGTGGYLSTITDAFGNVTTIEREEFPRATAIVGPHGQRTVLEALAPGGYLSALETPLGARFEMTYSSEGLLQTFENPRQQTTTFTYDSLGRLERDTDAASGFQDLDRTELTNGPGHSVAIATALGRTTTYTTETLEDGATRITVTAPDGTEDVSVRRLDGTSERTTADGTIVTSRKLPDPRFGMKSPVLSSATITTPGGLASTTTASRTVTFVDPAGDPLEPDNLLAIVDQVSVNARTVTASYDAPTRTLTTTSPLGRQATTTFDVFGRVAQVSAPEILPITYTYDSRGRLESALQGGRETRTTYDANGHVESIRDPLLREVRFTYDDDGKVLTQQLPDLRVIQFGYDANGNLTSLTPPGRPAHTFDHTPVDLNDEYDPPAVGLPEDRTLYAYNLDRQLELVTRPDGQTIDFVYGGTNGRLESLIAPHGTYSYGYEPSSGLLQSIADPSGGALAFAYDGSLPTSVTWTGTVSGSVAVEYNDSFEPVTRTINGTLETSYAYDLDGLLTQAGALDLDYDATSGFLEATTLGATTEELAYTPFGELDTYTARHGGAALYTYDLDRDGGGRIVSKVETIGGVASTWEYHYDTAGRLDEVKKDGAVVETYGYDANSNRTSWSDFWGSGVATYDDQDRMTTYGGATFTYTANGELLTKVEGPETTTYSYDAFGNIRAVSLPNGIELQYLVDAANRRIGRKVNGVLVQGFLWQSQLQPAAEVDGSGNVIAEFVYANGVNVPGTIVKAGQTYKVLTDNVGSVRLVVRATDGIVAQRLDYDAFGRVIVDTNPGFQPFGFAGGIYDYQTGLVRFGARDYDPETGRWTSSDPIRFEGGETNLFAYSALDPINLIDPSGTDALTEDPLVRQYLYDLWREGGKGRSETERAAWVIRNPKTGVYTCKRWPWSARRRQEKWEGPIPENIAGLVHTHPDSASEKPSTGGSKNNPKDDYAAKVIGKPVYVVTRNEIWKVTPEGIVTQEEGPDWRTGIEDRTCAKCE